MVNPHPRIPGGSVTVLGERRLTGAGRGALTNGQDRNLRRHGIFPANVRATCAPLTSALERAAIRSGAIIPMRIATLALCAISMLSLAGAARAQTYDPDYPVCLHEYGPMN